jgi:hypothetical protein
MNEAEHGSGASSSGIAGMKNVSSNALLEARDERAFLPDE